MEESGTISFNEFAVLVYQTFFPIFLFIAIMFSIYLFITFAVDRKRDYEKKGHKSIKYHDRQDYCDYIVVKYRIWERNKFNYLKSYYKNGNHVPFNGGDYVVTHMYPKVKDQRKFFFLFGPKINCFFKRSIYAYVKLVY